MKRKKEEGREQEQTFANPHPPFTPLPGFRLLYHPRDLRQGLHRCWFSIQASSPALCPQFTLAQSPPTSSTLPHHGPIGDAAQAPAFSFGLSLTSATLSVNPIRSFVHVLALQLTGLSKYSLKGFNKLKSSHHQTNNY